MFGRNKAIFKVIARVVLFAVISAGAILPGFSGRSFSELLSPQKAEAMTLDTVVSTLAGLGGAGAIVLVVAATTGLAGGAAIVSAISMLGGPFGLIGGVVGITLVGFIVKYVAEVGMEAIMEKLCRAWKAEGKSLAQIKEDVMWYNSYWIISDATAQSVIASVERYMKD